MILAIETSCDDTCAAVVEPDGRRALSNVVHTQAEHARYGGVVPEVASRAHLERLDGVVEKSLSDADVSLEQVDRVAVTTRPGLIGALLVGVAAAKGLAYARGLPLVPVNHLEGHVAAAYLTDPGLEPPFIALIASGGHTALYSVDLDHKMHLLGETLDDAAGKALDRERLSEELPHLAAGYEAAVVKALSRKLLRAVDLYNAPAVVVAGGVAANTSLRRTLKQQCAKTGTRPVVPPPELCTDNAAMIGAAAASAPAIPYPEYVSLNARSL